MSKSWSEVGGILIIGGAGLAQNETVVVARRAAKRTELDREMIASRFLATVTVTTRRVPITATFRALGRRRRRLANHTTTTTLI